MRKDDPASPGQGASGGFRVGDTVQWRYDHWRGKPKVITDVGLESPNPVMPGAQVRVRLEDGHETRVWVSDIELVPGAERGPLQCTDPATVPSLKLVSGNRWGWSDAAIEGFKDRARERKESEHGGK